MRGCEFVEASAICDVGHWPIFKCRFNLFEAVGERHGEYLVRLLVACGWNDQLYLCVDYAILGIRGAAWLRVDELARCDQYPVSVY